MGVGDNPSIARAIFAIGVFLCVSSLIAIGLLLPSVAKGSGQGLVELLVALISLGIGLSICVSTSMAVRSYLRRERLRVGKLLAAIVAIFAVLSVSWLGIYYSTTHAIHRSAPQSPPPRFSASTHTRALARPRLAEIHYLAPWPPIGVAYHLYEQPSPSTWRSDLEKMRKLGIDFVRVFYVAPTNAAWPGDGLDNSTLNEFLSLCDEMGMRVVITIAQYVPQWAPSNVSMVDQRGWSFSWWPSPCSRYWLRYMEKFVAQVVEVARRHRCVVAYNILNEYHMPENMYWDNRLCDYNPACVSEFERWCMHRVHNESLCLAPPRTPTDSWTSWSLTPRWIERWFLWRLFSAEKIANFTRMLVEEVRKLDPSRPVIVNEMPWWFWSQGGYSATSPKISFSVGEDYAAIDIYPAEPSGGWIAMALDSVRSLGGQRLGFGVLELNEKRGSPTAFEVANWVAMSLEMGSSFVGWFEWDDRFAKMDGGSYGLVDASKHLKPVATYLRLTIEGLRELGKPVREFARAYLSIPAKVAILYSEPNQMLVSSDWFIAFDWLAAYKLLTFGLGYKVDFVYASMRGVTGLDRYRVVVAPAQFFVSCSALKQIEKWVSNGGILVADPYFAYLSPCRSEFSKLFGVRVVSWSGLGNYSFYSQLCLGSTCVIAHGLQMLVEPTSARVVARAGGAPAITVNRFGKGYAILVAVSMHEAFYNPEGWGEILGKVLREVGAPPSSNVSRAALYLRKAFACSVELWSEGRNVSSYLEELGKLWSKVDASLVRNFSVSTSILEAARRLAEEVCG
ncbi:MAG: hypothetical protein GXO32_04385 [Crenarchaeota archaeon]|nr:hypothetical protein [Thermoproteota archaeon]